MHGDEVAWRSVEAMFDLAVYGSLLHAGLTHPDEFRRADCDWCLRTEEFWHVSLVDAITRRRGTTAAAVDSAIRAQVAQLLPGSAAADNAGVAG